MPAIKHSVPQPKPAKSTVWAKVKAAVLSHVVPATTPPVADAKATAAQPVPTQTGMRISDECLAAFGALGGKGADPLTGAQLGQRYPRAAGVNQNGIELRERFPRTP